MKEQTKELSKEQSKELRSLIIKYSVPAILSCLIASIYNIVDQIFIGNIIGIEGNAATNVAYPLVTFTAAIMLLIGMGCVANFSISLGKNDIANAKRFVGFALSTGPVIGIIITIITLLFTDQLIVFFGATENNFELARTYLRISALGYPLYITSESCTKLIRADGSPKYAMICSISGALLNCFLNPLLMIVFDMGIAGAALATIIGQFVSFSLTVSYFFRFKTFKITKDIFIPKFYTLKRVLTLGIASTINKFAMMTTQIAMNNILVIYGASSIYGTEIPLACVGIITKVNTIYMSIMIGIAQGAQPLLGYNYGAKNYDMVKNIYLKCVKYASTLSVFTFLSFQLFPKYIISLFGTGNELYFEFGIKYFRIFLLMTFLNSIQPITYNFFTAIGKPIRSIIISTTKQLLFLTPLMFILSYFIGIDGVLYAGPIADTLSFLLIMCFVRTELRNIKEKSLLNQ